MIRIANKQAAKSTFKQRLGAVLVNKGRVLGCGYNKTNRHISQWEPSWEGSAHAEELAILSALKKHSLDQLVGAVIYVSRLSKSGQLANAKPCNHCQEILRSFQIKKAIYTTESGVEELVLR